MDENTELLEYIYQNSKMGVDSLTKLLNIINGKDNKIKKLVEDLLKGYEIFVKDSEKLLKKYNVEPKKKSIMLNIISCISMKRELLCDNSDARIADMIIKGFTMGLVDINKRIDNYNKIVDEKILSLAKNLKKFSEDSIELLKPYL